MGKWRRCGRYGGGEGMGVEEREDGEGVGGKGGIKADALIVHENFSPR